MMSPWYQTLVAEVREQCGRWRWTSDLSNSGGSLLGSTQKQAVRVDLKCVRHLWTMEVYERMDTGWVLVEDPQTFRDPALIPPAIRRALESL